MPDLQGLQGLRQWSLGAQPRRWLVTICSSVCITAREPQHATFSHHTCMMLTHSVSPARLLLPVVCLMLPRVHGLPQSHPCQLSWVLG